MTKKVWDALWINGSIITCENNDSVFENSAIAVKDGKIFWLGKMSDLPDEAALAEEIYDVNGYLLTPGFIDCHTHLVYAGNRSKEFAWRLQGLTYAEIAKKGGGILTTVAATREASFQDLFNQSLSRARSLQASGVTTLEIKSGYGLDWETEKKMLAVAKAIGDYLSMTVVTTFLAAHSVPIEYQGRANDYVDLICHEMIPLIAKENLATAIDVYCEHLAFNLEQTKQLFKSANEYGLSIKCHAEQLSDLGASQLAADYKALSVDHLEYISLQGVKAIAQSGTVAVLLPGAFYFLREKQFPPIDLFRNHHIPIAIASDCNPGTSPILSLLLIVNMACTMFRLTPNEALLGVTKHAAAALGLLNTHGTLAIGKVADFAVWNVSNPAELAYYMGGNPLAQLVKAGKVIL